ncbi:hypothetical protein [Dyadobacter sediminis]|uniref:Uncharacterized protein n=1 Tax=Dyadobacter sediminis TaxID=1493691 RepID=A0A5R9KK78_9BACT|nr:hypothetical protein [Dyadobacter sediminis]TLU96620.1 hypothetical protein FEM55_05710 [Dyadobacter sediminis]GGB83793.1 hypothetical protein GCM10011325_09200 [Dyadobacter sediminis]
MKIKLQRFGGLLPVMKEATAEVDWSDQEVNKLLENIARNVSASLNERDATSHYLEVNGRSVPVDLQKIPAPYKKTFEELKENLKFKKE